MRISCKPDFDLMMLSDDTIPAVDQALRYFTIERKNSNTTVGQVKVLHLTFY